MTEVAIGSEPVAVLDRLLELTADPGLSVHVRIRDADGALQVHLASTAAQALQISDLFRRAALRADPAVGNLSNKGDVHAVRGT